MCSASLEDAISADCCSVLLCCPCAGMDHCQEEAQSSLQAGASSGLLGCGAKPSLSHTGLHPFLGFDPKSMDVT